MPVFAVGLFCSFIYQPKIKHLGDLFHLKKIPEIIREVRRMIVVILVVAVVFGLGAYWFGIPFLSLLYSTDLSVYHTEFMILMIASGMMAYINYFNVILVVIRQQKKMFWGYLSSVLVAILILPFSVRRHGIFGASVSYTAILTLQSILLFIIVWNSIKGELQHDA